MTSRDPLWRRILGDQRVRFIIVGGVNTLVGYTVFAVLTTSVFGTLRFGYLLSLLVSYAVAIVLAFLLYRRFVFAVSGRWWLDFVRFVSVYMLAIGINFLALPALVELVGLHPLVSQAMVLVATTLLSFVGHKLFSFRRPPSSPDDYERTELD